VPSATAARELGQRMVGRATTRRRDLAVRVHSEGPYRMVRGRNGIGAALPRRRQGPGRLPVGPCPRSDRASIRSGPRRRKPIEQVEGPIAAFDFLPMIGGYGSQNRRHQGRSVLARCAGARRAIQGSMACRGCSRRRTLLPEDRTHGRARPGNKVRRKTCGGRHGLMTTRGRSAP